MYAPSSSPVRSCRDAGGENARRKGLGITHPPEFSNTRYRAILELG